MEELEKLKLARLTVAPVWGRGLKFGADSWVGLPVRRPRMGAWIEMPLAQAQKMSGVVAPVWGRGLKSRI